MRSGHDVAGEGHGWRRPAAPVAAAMVAVALVAAGCDWFNGRDEPPPPPVSRITDVPVPHGFDFDEGKSTDRSSGGTRLVSHLYTAGLGGLNVRETTAFYKQSMPNGGWALVDEHYTDEIQRLYFEKAGETCYVSIWDDWGTKVLIQVYPKGSRPLPEMSEAVP